ncbi:WecB/TagA/CpsF family glycosyltransferase [Clostridium sp. UBA4548]|uniref:WecB/TagA/CpsF family glycosyltransferase n=1 Tax=Clostridium sp. UBA4548 TaxID=1946361 RepID=UPI0025BD38FC|nr:WecB/TagA/CpsF family glycosyltransferase [Clostridium sp. UBA4548]
MSTKLLNYNIYSDTKSNLINEIFKYEKVHIVSGNPEVLFQGLNNESLFRNFTSDNAIIIPDGVGTIIAAKMVKQPVKEKTAGIEVMDEIVRRCAETNKGIYLVGASQEIIEQCVLNLKKKYPDLNILGYHNGFFDQENCDDIIGDIKEKSPYALFVAMGAPRQENFIIKYMDELPCKVFMGVGGSFDVIAGKVNRAPKWMINIGLEWFYRVAKEPWRVKRLSSIPKFLIQVIKEK